jgi:hypothetical protein
MNTQETNNKSVTTQIVEEFIKSLDGIEEFDKALVEELTGLAKKKQLSNESALEKIINPENK